MKIAIDLMGGKGSGTQNLAACFDYPSPKELVLFGDAAKLDNKLIRQVLSAGAHLVPCTHKLTGNEQPRQLLKSGQGSSLYRCMQALANNEVEAVVSSADTKAMMVLGRKVVGTISELRRPAIAKAFQGPKGQFYMLDLGANVRCSPSMLGQFARLGCALQTANQIGEKRYKPRVALLNIGVERGKGTADLNEAARLLAADQTLRTMGFIEPSDLFSGEAEVIVCDGYAGNLVLKTIESMAGFLRGQLSQLPQSDSELQKLATRIDPDRYNGALLAGLEGVVVMSHGSTSPRGFLHAILQGRAYVSGQLTQACKQVLLD